MRADATVIHPQPLHATHTAHRGLCCCDCDCHCHCPPTPARRSMPDAPLRLAPTFPFNCAVALHNHSRIHPNGEHCRPATSSHIITIRSHSSSPLQPPKSAIAKGDKVGALPSPRPLESHRVQPKRPLGPYFIFQGEMRETVSISCNSICYCPSYPATVIKQFTSVVS